MILSDSKTNTEILYVYVKSFKWINPVSNEGFGGHPKEGRVYRAILNTDTKTYRIVYGKVGKQGQGILFPTLTSTNEEVGYVAEMVPLTKSNILNFEISEEDLDLLKTWLDADNKDIKQMYEPKTPVLPLPSPSWLQPPTNEMREINEFVECALELQTIDPVSFDTIHELIHVLNEPPTEPIEVLNIRMSKKFGAGANIVKVFEHLARYTGDDRRTNKDQKDLFEAQKYITYELNRLKMNQTD